MNLTHLMSSSSMFVCWCSLMPHRCYLLIVPTLLVDCWIRYDETNNTIWDNESLPNFHPLSPIFHTEPTKYLFYNNIVYDLLLKRYDFTSL